MNATTITREDDLLSDELKRLEKSFASLDSRVPSCSLKRRAELCEQSIQAIYHVAPRWASVGAEAKRCGERLDIVAEELLAGPVVITRFLRLAKWTLEQIERHGAPNFPKKPIVGDRGVVEVPIVPTQGLFDSLAFMGLHGVVRMQAGIGVENLHGDKVHRAKSTDFSKISAVLGAGNVSSVPATDSLSRILFEGRRVILKMNPVNSYLAPIFEEAFAPFISEGLLRIVTGDARVGHDLIHHPAIADIHITGSIASHDRIVWGPDLLAQQKQKSLGVPLIDKPITSELGNVSPWIIVPGSYSTREIDSQAQHVAASITNNAAFNCLATRVIVTWKKWPQRDHFLQRVQYFLKQTPTRKAYYPGAIERYCKHAACQVEPGAGQSLPWAFLTSQSIEERPELFAEESFACVCSETCLDASSPEQFVRDAVQFVNDRVFGSLCASITFPPGFRKEEPNVFDGAIRDLRYANICVNQWTALAYSLISPPWGGYPGATLDRAESGIGSVHNTYLLDAFEKTIIQGPLINFPRPVWFPAHRNALATTHALLSLYRQPSVTRLPRLFASALLG
jgi:acyl-CoA reductase-like NAD-dependent aldehyde dehydrogenase